MVGCSNLDTAIPDLQLSSAAAGYPVFIMPECLLAALTFSDYGSELIKSMYDIFWDTMLLPRLSFCAKNCMTAWAGYPDNSPDPVFPKAMGCITLLASIVIALCSDIHACN